MKLTDVQEKRFWKLVTRRGEDECWEWQGYRKKTSLRSFHGIFKVNGKNRYAHRISYQLAHGEIHRNLVVRHLCNNSVCVNPKHLKLGTHFDNMQDKVRAGRQARGGLNGRTKLTSKQVSLMRYSRKPHGYFAKLFNVDTKTIANARLGKTWAFLNERHPPQPKKYIMKGGHFGH